jgi:hypothetical protein
MADPAEPENLQGPAETAGATPEPARVFISYASPDAAIADAVCAALERGDFISVIHNEDLRLFETAIARDTLNQADAADAALKQLLEARNRDEFAIAEIYARRGDRDRAFEWLRRAREAHTDVREFRFSPLLDNLRLDPRYPALLAEWKLAD